MLFIYLLTIVIPGNNAYQPDWGSPLIINSGRDFGLSEDYYKKAQGGREDHVQNFAGR